MENSKPEIPSREFPVFLWLRLRLIQDQVRSDVAEGGVKIQSTNTKRPKATKQAKPIQTPAGHQTREAHLPATTAATATAATRKPSSPTSAGRFRCCVRYR